MSDLWPDDLVEATPPDSPVSILRQQASALYEITGGIVSALVTQSVKERMSMPFGCEISQSFHLYTPELRDYQYKLLSVYHGPRLYPLYLDVDGEVLGEICRLDPRVEKIASHPQLVKAESVEEFQYLLKLVFGASKTRKVIDGLRALGTRTPRDS